MKEWNRSCELSNYFIEKKIKKWAKSNELYIFANTDKSIYHFYLNDGSVNEFWS